MMKVSTLMKTTSDCRHRVEARLDAVRAKHGAWTAHNVALPHGVFTIGPDASTSDTERADYFAGVVMSVLGRSLRGVRVLDLGCLEGGLSIQFARLGAQVDGLDIRGDSIAKARVAAELLGLQNARFLEGDVLDLRSNSSLQPTYDVILCAGLLYHLDAQDQIPFMRSLARLCTGLALIDTHISVDGSDQYLTPEGIIMRGRFIAENGASCADRRSAMWASWANNRSFWPTEASLLNALQSAGFAFVASARHPVFRWPWRDRSTWLAFKGIEGAVVPSPEPATEIDERPVTHPSVAAGRNVGVQL
jgi:2-polyprenyl-3-methyl-5-hydroxy-6-metoxy-1,4-benzoquinol methylase